VSIRPPALLLVALTLLGTSSAAAPVKRVPPELQERIDRAIDRGAAALRGMQRDGGAIPYGQASLTAGTIGLHQGATALGLLAILHAGVPPDDPAIRRGVDWILRAGRSQGISTHHRYVYATGLVIWLLAEVDPVLYRPEITELAARLAHGAAADGTWGYYSGGLGGLVQDLPNMSTTQYAVLGLWEASKAGVKLPRRTWDKLERTLRNGQRHDGGWTYVPRQGSPTFTSTAIGVASLVLARVALAKDGDEAAAALRSTEVRLGLGWMARSFDEVLRPRWTDLDYYGLYAAERAGILAEVRRMGERDWYAEGARRLLDVQREDGSWEARSDARIPPAVATAFAVLFLTRATRPVVTEEPGTAEGTGGLDVEGAAKLSDKDFADLVDALLSGIASGPTPAGALEKLEALAPRVLTVLVDRLESDDAAVRRAAITALHALSGTRRGFDPDRPEAERREAIARWRQAVGAPAQSPHTK
jgi:hypothetical protein